MKLRPYQQQAHDAAIDWIKKCTDPCVLELPTGSGKSLIVAAIANTLHKVSGGKHILCLVPSKELLEQNAEKYRDTGNQCSLFSASVGETCLKHPVVFGTPVSVKNKIHRFGAKFCAVVLDECFTGETMVLTENGEKRIDEIKIGEVLCNAIGRGIVRSIFSKISSTIILELSNGTKIECTGDHPIFTEKGFIEAKRLENGTRLYSREDVRILWGSFSAKTNDFKKRKYCCKHFGITLEQATMLFNVLLKEKEKSNVFTGKQGKNAFKAKRKTPYPNDAWRERSVTKHSTTCTMAHTWERMGNGIVGCDKKRSFKRCLSKSLQNRYCKQGIDDCNRGRRQFALLNKKTRRGLEKTNGFGGIGVVSLSSIKRGCDRVVFNLRVSGHPSYFANGFLVHNCHRITPTVKSIIESLAHHNPNLRVIGLSATPYRLGDGYIYRMDEHSNAHGNDKAKNPYFSAKVFTVYARDLIKQGYLTQPIIGGINSGHYDTLDMELNSMGKFAKADVDKAYHGQGRLTSAIVGDIVAQAVDRQGVMIFSATVQHAHEVMQSLPPGLSCIVTGATPKQEREQILRKFKSRELKYLVNVSVLITGFDAPHVDLIAILRATESVSLLQQIIGRGLRIENNKNDCLILDYAENIDRHCHDGDIFNPEIEASTDYVAGEAIKAQCPECKAHNEFAPVINEAKHEIDVNGYFIDLEGIRLETEFGEMPAHHGRRCFGEVFNKTIRKLVRCDYRWTFKPCPHCEEENDIAARYCCSCKGELIDPNSKLVADFQMKKKDPTQIQTDKVVAMRATFTLSKAGNECLRVDFVTEYRSFPVWFTMKMQKHYDAFITFTSKGSIMPNTITYRKSGDFYRIYAYNEVADEVPS